MIFPNYSVSEDGKIYNSIKEAADELGLYHSNIVACCNGRRATCGGLEWKYI